MKICYYGHSCFQFTTKTGGRILTDPYQRVGYELPKRLQADIVTVSHEHFDHNYVEAVNAKNILRNSGTYHIDQMQFEAIESYHDPMHGKLRGKNLIFKMYIDGLTICHLGDLGEELSEDLIKKIGQVDVLLLPIGGTYTIDAKQAKEYAQAIMPKMVVLMHFKPQDGTLDIATPDAFLELNNADTIQYVDREVEITVENIEEYKDKIILMERCK